MDRIDRKILALYQHDTRRIASSIGEAVGLSAAAVQRRLKRLRETGAIRREIALLDNAAAGVPITCIVALKMATKPTELDLFKRRLASHAAVQQCYHVTGTHDLILIVTARSMEDYGAFARQYFESSPQVARYETHVALDRVKIGLSLPIESAAAPQTRRRPAKRRPRQSTR
jgi:Lrp/AsnC family transcriptional regulator, leucine-responsive regulatory protein